MNCSRSECSDKICVECMEACDNCKQVWCTDCFNNMQTRCSICKLCPNCTREEGLTPATFCGPCGTNHCDSCCSFRCPRPIANKNKMLEEENSRLKKEIRRLKKENRRLASSKGV